jgi:hypothetical protein
MSLTKSVSNKVVLYVKKNENSTATRISKDVLFTSKASASLKEELTTLVENGTLSVYNGGRFVTYSAGSGTSGVTTIKASKKPMVKVGSPDSLTADTLSGFTAKKKSGRVHVHCPPNKAFPKGYKVSLADGAYLLVINGEPKFKVEDANDTLSAISTYATEQGMASFAVSDVKTNTDISGKTDIVLGEGRILSLKVGKVNKAA